MHVATILMASIFGQQKREKETEEGEIQRKREERERRKRKERETRRLSIGGKIKELNIFKNMNTL